MPKPTTALAIGKGSTVLAMVGGSGLAANELITSAEASIVEVNPIHKEIGPYKEWWNDMLKNEKSNKNAGLRDYELRPGSCSREFFYGIQSFDKLEEIKTRSENEPYGCISMNSWHDGESENNSTRFAAKLETVFIKDKKGLITTTLLMPHDEKKDHLKEVYLRYELDKDETDSKWKVSNGYGWVYSGSVSSKTNKVIFSGKSWNKDEQEQILDISKLCSRSFANPKNNQESAKTCQAPTDDKKINDNFKHAHILLSTDTAWTSPFKENRIKFKSNQNKDSNLGMWSNGDLNSQCINISYRWQNSTWTKETTKSSVWISKTSDYFATTPQQTQSCSK